MKIKFEQELPLFSSTADSQPFKRVRKNRRVIQIKIDISTADRGTSESDCHLWYRENGCRGLTREGGRCLTRMGEGRE